MSNIQTDLSDRSTFERGHESTPVVWRPDHISSIDLLLNLLVLLLGVAAVLLEFPAGFRVPLGILLVLFLPGHAIVCALFPSNEGPDGVARAALSVALSLAAIPLVALAVDRSPWPIETVSMTVGLASMVLVALAASIIVRTRLPISERYAPQSWFSAVPNPRQWSNEQKVIVGLVALSAILFVGGGYQAAKSRLVGAQLTEFAVYNTEGDAEYYPRSVVVGKPAVVQIAITNREGEQVEYRLTVTGAGVAVDPSLPIVLEDGQTWQSEVRFTVAFPGERQPVRFELHRADQTDEQPYRELVLLVNGVRSDGGNSR